MGFFKTVLGLAPKQGRSTESKTEARTGRMFPHHPKRPDPNSKRSQGDTSRYRRF